MAKQEKMGKILPFRRPKPAAREPLEDNGPKVLGKEAFIALLDGIAPAPSSLEPALEPPTKLYLVGEGPSISSDPDKSISSLALSLVRGDDVDPKLIEDAPDYGVAFTYRKSTSFCVFLDKSRKILVVAALGSSLGGGLEWEPAVTAITDALKERDERTGRSEKFSLLLNQEMVMKAL